MRASGLPVLAVNDSYRLAPWATALYACDECWWAMHIDAVRRQFTGALWTTYWDRCRDKNPAIAKYTLNAIHSVPYNGGPRRCEMLTRPGEIVQGSNSGLQAVNLAYHYGATAVLLLGYDMGVAANGRRHFFGDHPRGLGNDSNYEQYRRKFAELNPPMPVINCSRRTWLECFERVPLADALAMYAPARPPRWGASSIK